MDWIGCSQIILSQNTQLSGKNHNVLVVGVAGSGKTRCYVLPNLLACNGSYVVFDCCGCLQQETEKLMRQEGYSIKAIDVRKMNEEEIKKVEVSSLGLVPTVVYVSVGYGFENERYSSKITVLFERLVIASQNAKIPTHFFLDEFHNLVQLSGIGTFLKNKNPLVSCSLIVQSVQQGEALYGEKWAQLIDSCDIFLFLGSHNARDLQFVSKKLGKYTLGFKSARVDKLKRMSADMCLIMRPWRLPAIDKKFGSLNHPNYPD